MHIHVLHQGHTYFTLEPGGGTHGVITSPSNNSDAQNPPQPGGSVSAPPVYQEINDIAPTSRREAAAKSLADKGENISSTPFSNSNPDRDTPKPVG